MTTLATKQIEEDLVDDWEDIPSDDEVEDLVEKEVSKEVVDPNKKKREALEKEIRNMNSLIFTNNEKLENLKKSSKELLLNRKKTWFKNNKPVQAHWLYWVFCKNYLRKFPEKDTIIVDGKSVYNIRGKRMIPQWKQRMIKKVNNWGNSTNSKSYTMQDLQTYYPTQIPAEAQGPRKDRIKLLTATGAPVEQVQEYILFKWEEIKETVSKKEKEIKEEIEKTQEKINNLKNKIEILKY